MMIFRSKVVSCDDDGAAWIDKMGKNRNDLLSLISAMLTYPAYYLVGGRRSFEAVLEELAPSEGRIDE